VKTTTIIERIKYHLSAGRDGPSEEGSLIAEQYAALSKAANARLSECSGLIKAGMLSEALRKAEAFPPLLELCAELDFPEAGAWIDLCRGRRWTTPERIDANAVAVVSEAYSSQDALEPLVRSFRKAALKRSLKQCIILLRKLIALDPMREDWPKDLAKFEARRLEQIAIQAKLADERESESALGVLLMELNAEWLGDAAKPLRDTVRASLARIHGKETEAKADALVASILKGYNALSIDMVEKGFRTLAEMTKSGDLRPSPERQEKVREAWEWLEEARRQLRRDAHQRELMGKIETALDKQDAPACHTAYTEFVRNEYPMDDGTRNRVVQLFEMQKRLDHMKHKRKVMAIVAALALLAGGLVVGLLQLKMKIARENLQVALAECIQSEDITRADDLVSKASAKTKRIVRSAAIEPLLAQIEEIRTRHRDMAERFTAAVGNLRQMESDGFAGRESEAVEQIKVADANRPKGGAPQDYLVLVANFEEHMRNRMSTADQNVMGVVNPLRDSLAELEQQGDRGETTDKVLGDINQKLTEGLPDLAVSSESTKTTVATLAAAVSSFQASIDSQRKQLETFRQSKTIEDYLSSAKAFILAFPDVPASKDFTRFTALETLYQAYTAKGAGGELIYGNNHKVMAELNEKWPDVKDAITGLERDRRMTMLTLADNNGKKFYWESWPTEQRMETGVMGYAGLAYAPNPLDVEPTFERKVMPKASMKLMLSPHCEVIRDLIVQCRMVSSGGEALPVLFAQLQKIAVNEEVDPLLRFRIAAFVADRIRDMVLEGTSPRLDQLCRDLSLIDPEVAWLCVNSTSTKAGNEKAKVILGQHFSNSPSTANIVAFELALKSAVALRGMTYAGMGAPTVPGGFRWRSGEGPEECFLVRKDKDGNPTVLLAGEKRDGEFKVYTKPGEGEPVFAPSDGKTVWSILQSCRANTNVGKLPPPSELRAWPSNVK
jgi:hypothetical protein